MDRDDLYLLAEVHPDEREEAFSKAVSFVSDPSLELRAACAEAIAATGAPADAIEALSKLADDEAAGVRLSAVAALSSLPWRGRIEALRRKLTDADRGIVLTTADGLAWAGDTEVAPVLRTFVTDRRLRFDALDALLSLNDPSLLETARTMFRSFFTPLFERALSAVVLAAEGDEPARAHLRTRLGKKRAQERPFVLMHLARVDPEQGRPLVEAIARAPDDYLRESALLALARLDDVWWAPAQEAIGRWSDEDPHVSGEVLQGLFELDWNRASLIADAHVHRDSELGQAARRLRLQSALRDSFASEVLVR